MVSLAVTHQTSGSVDPSVGSSLKRKQTDSKQQLSSQAKRRRVAFDLNHDIHILADPNEKSQELVLEEVHRALEKHAAGDATAYDVLRSLFTTKPTATDAPLSGLLEKYVVALTQNVTRLDGCRGLVHAVLDCHWAARNQDFVHSYRRFLRSLLSLYPGFTSTVLGMLVGMFVEPPSPRMRQEDDPAIPRAQLQSRVHDTLRFLLRQGSMTATYLQPLLSSNFPFSTDTSKAHIQYINNILKVTEYCPELKRAILSLIMDKLVKIDVQIQVDMEELDDDLEDQLIEDYARELDDEDDESDNESVSSEESLDDDERRLKEIKESVTKLDNIMFLLFQHYDSVFQKGDLHEIDEAYESLLSQFSNIILPTYRSRHTQFLLFHFSQMTPDLIDRFAVQCTQLAFDQSRPQILRVAAAAYLASFIARGAHVPRQTVCDVFELLGEQLEILRKQLEPNCKGPDLRRYGTYYAISQALLYAFCFRWRDLIETADGRAPTDHDIVYHEGDFKWYKEVNKTLQKNVFSKLNPLKICAPTIVQQFARIAHHLRFMYVNSLIETNKRIRLTNMVGVGSRETALTMKRGEEGFLLDAYFPFDPYVLPRSKKWIEGDYVQWKPIPGMVIPREDDEEDEEESDDETDADDDDDDDESTVGLPTAPTEGFDLDDGTDASSA
ncbi:RNA polymerase I-specific transcription initiation factor RRN3 [Bimuria novae-zelandiae CBS 107.79]|uniref:RNA polymerase I-specific transcription initiation factor RRN3 n=1 Tax=Bimuria novae-zelandiae CBS 107.79 TaxID=1447943 RepID=A0A6A5VGL3_9PLEO|nr:RNA polymerase I-specific transcription initiation factor RRN3 [Bimuria novae-zelandiae CBS 107.79]